MRAVQLQLRPEGGAFPGVDEALQALEGVRRETLIDLDWQSDGSYVLLYRLAGDDVDALGDLLGTHDDVRSYDLVRDGGDGIYAFVHVTPRETLSKLLGIAEDNALLLDPPFRYTTDGVRVTVAGREDSLQSAFAAVGEYVDVEVRSTGEYVPDRPASLDRLTDRQYEALVTAHDLGYYETPRSVSFEDVAAELDCAPSTANELLRRAESELVDAVLAR